MKFHEIFVEKNKFMIIIFYNNKNFVKSEFRISWVNKCIFYKTGYDISLSCLSTGEYEIRTEWPECREPVECKELPPLPDSESGLAETTSEVTKEGEDAIYKCSEPDYLVMGAKPEFKLTCGSDGFFPMLAEWPECRDPEATTTSTTTVNNNNKKVF